MTLELILLANARRPPVQYMTELDTHGEQILKASSLKLYI